MELLSVSQGGAVIARIGGAQPLAGLRVDADGVHEAHVPVPPSFVPEARSLPPAALNFVAARTQRLLHAFRKFSFHADAIREPLLMESRRIDGRLRLHAEAH